MIASPLAAGVWGVVVTPFVGSTYDVDEASLARLVEHYEHIGVTGLTVLGVFGEAAKLSSGERRAVLDTVVDAVALPLVVGTSSLGTAPVIEEIEAAGEAVGDRLAGAMVQVNAADPEVLGDHLRDIHEATRAGIVVQDYPLASGVTIPSDHLAAALRDTPGLVGVKEEASPTAVAVAALTRALPELPVFGGLGGLNLLDELAAGAAGAMTGFSAPEGLVACVRSYEKGGYDAARKAFLPYLPLVNFEQQPGIGLAIRKESLRQRGLILESAVRPASAPMPGSMLPQLDRHLTAIASSLSTEVSP